MVQMNYFQTDGKSQMQKQQTYGFKGENGETGTITTPAGISWRLQPHGYKPARPQ